MSTLRGTREHETPAHKAKRDSGPRYKGELRTSSDTITVRLDRRAYTPVLRQADLPHDTPVPWWGNRTLRFEFR